MLTVLMRYDRKYPIAYFHFRYIVPECQENRRVCKTKGKPRPPYDYWNFVFSDSSGSSSKAQIIKKNSNGFCYKLAITLLKNEYPLEFVQVQFSKIGSKPTRADILVAV